MRLPIAAAPLALIASLSSGPASAQPAPDAEPSPNLLGDIGGVRTVLGDYGISLGLQDTEEAFDNTTGGLKRGIGYDGMAMLSVGLDTSKKLWDGGIFNISILNIHGRNNYSQNYLGVLQQVSGIEATPTTRLWELWYQQAFPGGDVKLGEQSVDQEFIYSQAAQLFLNSDMGWPVVPSVDLYAGGPTYPLSSLGVRFRGQPTDAITLLAGVFDDNPPGGPFANDPQLRGASRYGANFSLRTGALFIAEAQYAINPPPKDNTDTAPPTGLPGAYKFGFWYDTGSFPDQRYDTNGVPLASPLSNGSPAQHSGNYSIYIVADQAVWRPDSKSPQTLTLFARIMGAPGDRNQVDFGVTAGATLQAPLPNRDKDTVGIGYGLGRIGSSAADAVGLTGTYLPIRGSEQFIEITYQAALTGWLQMQPDFQYIFMPGGGVVNPYQPTTRLGNEAVFGLRFVANF